ncbi:MAG: lysostaphin resistance A-like protein [Candidatus Polarisedimenticolia bacterium]
METPAYLRAWRRLPVSIRAVLAGCAVLTAGGLMTGPLIFANLKLWPAVPWSVPLLAGYMWLFWQYMNGRWAPRATADDRCSGLRARRLSAAVWRWALVAGYLGMTSSYALHWVVGRLAPLHYDIPEVLQPLPFFTLLCILLMASAVAGIVEEAAFRGFMQGPIERRHGVVPAILVVSAVFGLAHLTDWQPSMTIARMFFIVAASVVYGILVHMVDSISPGVVLHATGDAIGIVWIWWLSARPGPRSTHGSLTAALGDPGFLVACAVAVIFGAGAVWGFRRLSRVLETERAASMAVREREAWI